jgi:periplasmic divalent cation tolerance protein
MTEKTLVVLTTCGNEADAGALARILVERRVAACVNAIGGVASTYRWKGKIQQDQETLLIIKTTGTRFEALERTIREHSKYELPEILALPVQAGGSDYLAWLRESVTELKD